MITLSFNPFVKAKPLIIRLYYEYSLRLGVVQITIIKN